MNSYHCQLLFAFLLLFAFAREGASLSCFTCKSGGTGECGDPFKSANMIATNCTDRTDGCLKLKEIISDKNNEIIEVNRGCVPKNFCEKLNSQHCSVCNMNKCNSSPTFLPSIFGTFMSIVLLRF